MIYVHAVLYIIYLLWQAVRQWQAGKQAGRQTDNGSKQAGRKAGRVQWGS